MDGWNLIRSQEQRHTEGGINIDTRETTTTNNNDNNLDEIKLRLLSGIQQIHKTKIKKC